MFNQSIFDSVNTYSNIVQLINSSECIQLWKIMRNSKRVGCLPLMKLTGMGLGEFNKKFPITEHTGLSLSTLRSLEVSRLKEVQTKEDRIL